ncbi:MAG TPA: hypothetical protein VGS19_13380 [Streptosporangiaceae bacterium]|nr:hypothetical protein [Streptosporangiaceae bacterium]
MTHPSSEAAVHPDTARSPRDNATRPAESSDPASSSAARRAWFPPSIQDFEIRPEAAMYAANR